MRAQVRYMAVVCGVVLAASAIAGEHQVFGTAMKGAQTVSLAQLAADPMAFQGKVVRVAGKVLDVCPKKGCWMELGGADGRVRVKVEDDVIVFPQSAKGQAAVAEGKVEVVEMERAQYVSWLEHLAAERGEKLDPASVGAGPYRMVQIQATGAEIEGP